jgi:integrase
MVTVQLKGAHVVKAKGREYHYAWRGGPRLQGEPGSDQYIKSFAAAHQARKAPVAGTFRDIITKYRASPAYTRLSDHTKRAYAKHLDTIEAKWGTMPRAVLETPGVRTHFLKWRDGMASTPRTADMAIGVLKRVLEWGRENVMVDTNEAEPISRLHSVNKSDAIWTEADIKAFRAHASKELVWALELAIHTGLRQSDLIRLAWNHEEDGAFVYRTSKRNKEVAVPIRRDQPALRRSGIQPGRAHDGLVGRRR